MMSGNMEQGTCSLQASCNELPVPLLAFSPSRRKGQAIKPGGNLIKSDKRKQFHVFKQELSWRGSWPQGMPKDVDLAGIRRGLDL